MGMDDGEAGMIASVAEMRVVVDNEDVPDRAERAEELRILEALLFAAEAPLDEKTLAARLPAGVDVRALLLQLQQEYEARGVNLVRVGGKWSLRTAGDLAWLLTRETVVTRKLSRAAIETLAIVAYHQPVTRAEIEEIRGVTTSKGTLDVLLETGWIRLRGRRKAPGRPVTYGTTEAFMSHFGLDALADLPGIDELKGAGLIDKSLPAGLFRAGPVRRSGAAGRRRPAGTRRPRFWAGAALRTDRGIGKTPALRHVLNVAACGGLPASSGNACFCRLRRLVSEVELARPTGRPRALLRTEDFMGSLSIWHWLIVGAVLLLVFGGRGKISDMMGDVAKGIKAFKRGMSEEETADAKKSDAPVKSIDHQAAADVKQRAESKVS